jgi:hypothetical protein
VLLGLGIEVAALQQPRKEALGDAVVVLRVGVGKEVVGQAHLLKRLQKLGMEALEHLARRNAFLVSTYSDGRAVRVRAGDHEHVVALQAVITGVNVRRQVGAGHVAHVDRRAGIGPGDANQDFLFHRSSPLITNAPGSIKQKGGLFGPPIANATSAARAWRAPIDCQ